MIGSNDPTFKLASNASECPAELEFRRYRCGLLTKDRVPGERATFSQDPESIEVVLVFKASAPDDQRRCGDCSDKLSIC
jgi:hypothetical protein